MKAIAILAVAAASSAVQAASVTYNYETATPSTAVITGSGFSTPTYTEAFSTNSGNTNATFALATGTSFTQGRGFRPDQVSAAPSALATDSHLDIAFGVTNAGDAFDLSAATLSFNVLAGTAASSGETGTVRAYVSTDGGTTFTALGTAATSAATSAVSSGAGNGKRTSPTDTNAAANPFNLTQSSASISLASITDATQLLFRIGVGDNSGSAINISQTNSTAGGASSGVKFVMLDNISISNFATPEPSSLALLGVGGVALLRRRK